MCVPTCFCIYVDFFSLMETPLCTLNQGITKNAPYAWGNFHACTITRFQKPQQLGRARIACSSIVMSRAQWAEPDLSGQRYCKLRLKLLLVDQLVKKTWKLIVEFVTTKRLVCKNGHSLVEPPSRVFLYGIGLCMSLRRWTILSKSLRAPVPVNLTIHTFRTVDRTAGRHFAIAVVAWFGKRWKFGDNREICKAFVCQYAPPHSCCRWGPAEAKCCMPAPRRLHWMASVRGDVIDAEFALRRCHLSLTERIFFSFALFTKNVAIDLKCIENYGGKPW